MNDEATMWKNLGFIDTLLHTHGLTTPALLTAGGADVICPPNSIQSLLQETTKTKAITHLDSLEHDTTQ
jgi:cephalosporin-C deacetylase-like acetyl esterase